MSTEKFENTSDISKELLRERLKDVYSRLRRKKIKESGSFFRQDVRISENRLKDGEISEEDFYDGLSDLLHQYGIEWWPEENRDFIRSKQDE